MATTPAPLANLAYYYDVADPNDPGASAFLQELRKYDPTASYVPTSQISSGGEGGTQSSGTTYRLSFNPSKLPGVDGTGSITGATSTIGPGGTAAWAPNFAPADPGHMLDPSQVQHSSVYGDIANTGNRILPENDKLLSILGPLAVAAFGFGAPALAAMMSEGVLGGAAAGAGAAGAGAGADLSGLGASDPFLTGGTGAMDISGSLGTGLPGSTGLLNPAGGLEFGMYDRGLGTVLGSEAGTTGVLSPSEIAALSPGGGFGMNDRGLGTTTGTQANTTGVLSPEEIRGLTPGGGAPITDLSTPARLSDQLRLNPFGTTWDQLVSGLTPSNLARAATGLLGGGGGGAGAGGGSGGGGGGGNLLINAAQQQRPQVEDAAAILARLYGQRSGGLLGAKNG